MLVQIRDISSILYRDGRQYGFIPAVVVCWKDTETLMSRRATWQQCLLLAIFSTSFSRVALWTTCSRVSIPFRCLTFCAW